MIIKLHMANIDMSDARKDKITKYLNCDTDNLYYVENINNEALNCSKVFLTEGNISFCRNKDGYSLISFKEKGYIVTKDFLKFFNIWNFDNPVI